MKIFKASLDVHKSTLIVINHPVVNDGGPKFISCTCAGPTGPWIMVLRTGTKELKVHCGIPARVDNSLHCLKGGLLNAVWEDVKSMN